MVDRHAYDCLCQDCLNADVSACNTAKAPREMRPAALAIEIMRLREAKSTWDRAGAALERLALLEGGPRKVFKPCVHVSWYDHDGQATVEVESRMDVAVLVDLFAAGGEGAATAILRALEAAEKQAQEGS